MKVFVTVFAVCLLFSLSVCASDPSDVQYYSADEFGTDSIIDALPDEVRDALPDGDIYSADGFTEGFDINYFFGLIGKALSAALSPALRALSLTMGVIIAASALSSLKTLFSSGAVSKVFELAGGLAVMLTLYGTVLGLAQTVREYLTRLAAIVGASVPVMAAVNVAGGNVNGATVSSNGMMIGLFAVEALSSEVLFPVLQLCFGLAVASGMGGSLRLGGISKLVRGVLTFIFALVGAVISAVMTFQSSIAAHADSLSMRAVKFAATQSIPVVGGVAGDAVGAVATSLSLVKSAVGWVGVVLILITTLPVALELLLTRLGVSISVAVADMIGMDHEKALLSEICGLLGFLTAVSVIASIMFVYAMALFAGSAAALS